MQDSSMEEQDWMYKKKKSWDGYNTLKTSWGTIKLITPLVKFVIKKKRRLVKCDFEIKRCLP